MRTMTPTLRRLNALSLSGLMMAGTTAPTMLMTSCESLPGDRESQGAVIGGAGGAVLGAVIAKENRLIGALIGGLLGAGAGWLVGAKTDWFDDDEDDVEREARAAVEKAQANPATAAQARSARTGDINNDGFVTLDEVIAMEDAGFDDAQIVDRLEATGQVFDLSPSQEDVLYDNGVSNNVIRRMRDINKDERDRVLAKSRTETDETRDTTVDDIDDDTSDVISSDPDDGSSADSDMPDR